MAVVLISKRVTNMQQIQNIYICKGNEAASRKNKPHHSRKNVMVTKIC